MEELKERIREECANIPSIMIKQAIRNMKKRARQCRLNLGGAFEGRKPL